MDNLLHLSASPHIHSSHSTRRVMLDVIISLLPATIAGVLIFGARAFFVVALCVGTCVLSEFLFNLVVKKEQSVGDLSAIVTGLLLALNLPANIPVWQAIVGSVFAIVVVKCCFGGIGKNIVNPAITARVFMLVAFGDMAKAAIPTGVVTNFGASMRESFYKAISNVVDIPDIVADKLATVVSTPEAFVDAVSGATPLATLAEDTAPDLLTLFLGNYGGAIGETCTLALIIGGIYLMIRHIVTWHLPVSFIGTVFLFTLVLVDFNFVTALSYTLSGGLFIGAIFMATDYVTSPATWDGQLIFGVLAGLITVMIRVFGTYPEGVSFAILLMNILTPYIDIWTARKIFGGAKR